MATQGFLKNLFRSTGPLGKAKVLLKNAELETHRDGFRRWSWSWLLGGLEVAFQEVN